MKRFYAIAILFICSASLQAQHANPAAVKSSHYARGIYRIQLEEKKNMAIWIVDGLTVRREIFAEFLYGGNPAPYLFVPANEIWIDNAISAEEFEYTLAHELNEYSLMMKKRMSYSAAHDSSLSLERKMRNNDLLTAAEHERITRRVSPTDCDGLKQIKELPDSISLKNIYRQKYSSVNGIDIWIIDGAKVRRDIFPDFGFSGNDLAYNFIPRNEIWIDGQVSCEETDISIKAELEERALLKTGLLYDDAYNTMIKTIKKYRAGLQKTALKHPPVKIPATLTREYSINKEVSSSPNTRLHIQRA